MFHPQKLVICRDCHCEYDSSIKVYSGKELNEVLYKASKLENFQFTDAEKKAAEKIVWRESRGKPSDVTSRSSSKGLFGLLDSTRRDVRVKHNLCPICQTRSGIRYIKARPEYRGSFLRAWRFHIRNNWY